MLGRLTQTADGLALILDQDLAYRLHLDADTTLEITTDGRAMTIAPAGSAEKVRELRSAMDWIAASYPKTLRDLAQ